MGALIAVQVEESTTTEGTGTLNLGGAASGKRSFVSAFGSAQPCLYAILGDGIWEYGLGTITDSSPDTLSRDLALWSSSYGAKLSLPAGTKRVLSDILPYNGAHSGSQQITRTGIFISAKNATVIELSANSSAMLADINDGTPGQEITLIAKDVNTTIGNGDPFYLSDSWQPGAKDTLTLIRYGTGWYEKCRSNN